MSLQSLIDRPKELLELIADCLKPKDVEKKQFGEVFTPMSIVEEMLDKLPMKVWTNKNLKWLDPAAGMGNFPIAVYLRLMETLKQEIPDDTERKAHILNNMLFMCELNKKNVVICQQIFDMNNNHKLNLYEGDTLEFNPEETFGIKQFDIVMGNPPYNKGGIRSHTGKQLGDKNETIWTPFVKKSMSWLVPKGYLVFITPLSWLKKSHSVHNLLLDKHIIWLKLWDNSQSKHMINADIPISLYVMKNKNNSRKLTNVISVLRRRGLTSESAVFLNKEYSIPLAYHSIFNKLSSFIEDNNLQLEFNTKTTKSTGGKIGLPTEYTKDDMYAIDTYTLKDGILVKKSIEMHPDADKRKIIIANKSSFAGMFIDEGKLGLTGAGKFYILGDNLDIMLKLLSFGIFNIVCHCTKYGQDFVCKVIFEYIPDIRKLNIGDITEEQFYKMIKLTAEEIHMIKT